MSKAPPDLAADRTGPPPAVPQPLSHRVEPSALATLAVLSLERTVRGRRLLVLALLFVLPTVFALLMRRSNPIYRPAEAEEALVFYMIPQALVPLTALVLTSGLVQDEVEEQTLTCLLVRPRPRWAIYLAKLLAMVVVAAALTALFTTLALAVIHWGESEFTAAILVDRAPRVAALLALANLAYGTLFGCLSLFLRRSLVAGVLYIILFEGFFANIDFVARRATVMYSVRVLAERWLGLYVEPWSIRLDEAPSGSTCLLTLLIASAVATAVAAVAFSLREFRVKTPEGN